MSIRNKPRYKIAYQSGYNVLGKKNFDNLNRKKWRQIKKRETFKPKFAAVVPVRNLYGQRLRSKQALKSLYGKMTDNCLKNVHGCLSVDMMRALAILICIFEGSTFLFDTCPTAIRD